MNNQVKLFILHEIPLLIFNIFIHVLNLNFDQI